MFFFTLFFMCSEMTILYINIYEGNQLQDLNNTFILQKVKLLMYCMNINLHFRSEQFQKREAKEAILREANSPMNNCVLKFDHFENIHR